MAIPSFNGFQKRARDSEAKVNLGSIYTAEKGYFYEASNYNNDLKGIGFAQPDGTRYFSIGFGDACAGTCSDRTHTTQSVCENPANGGTWTPGTCKYDATTSGTKRAPGTACKVDNGANPKEFTVGAFGNGTGENLDDVGANYQMDQGKKLLSIETDADCS